MDANEASINTNVNTTVDDTTDDQQMAVSALEKLLPTLVPFLDAAAITEHISESNEARLVPLRAVLADIKAIAAGQTIGNTEPSFIGLPQGPDLRTVAALLPAKHQLHILKTENDRLEAEILAAAESAASGLPVPQPVVSQPDLDLSYFSDPPPRLTLPTELTRLSLLVRQTDEHNRAIVETLRLISVATSSRDHALTESAQIGDFFFVSKKHCDIARLMCVCGHLDPAGTFREEIQRDLSTLRSDPRRRLEVLQSWRALETRRGAAEAGAGVNQNQDRAEVEAADPESQMDVDTLT